MWESCAPEGPWLYYPGNRTYVFNWATEFETALGASPNAAALVAELPEPLGRTGVDREWRPQRCGYQHRHRSWIGGRVAGAEQSADDDGEYDVRG